MSKFKIRLVVPWYGKLPPYFLLWLDSCSQNDMLDFLFVTDEDLSSYNIPENVHILVESFQKLKQRFQKLFDFQIALNQPYKLCDFRPVYGLAFQDELKGFDFWGYCDIDLIFGNVSKFLTDDILSQYDKIFEYGHFMLYRNTKRMRIMYQSRGSDFSYREVYIHDEGFAFDEMFGMNKIADVNHVRCFKTSFCKDIPYTMYGIVSSSKRKREELFYKEGHSVYGAFLESGNIVNDEYMYIHFQKKLVIPTFDSNHIPESYYISLKHCMERKKTGEITVNEILSYTDYTHSISKNKLKINWKLKRIWNVFFKGSWQGRKIFIKNAVNLLKRRLGLSE